MRISWAWGQRRRGPFVFVVTALVLTVPEFAAAAEYSAREHQLIKELIAFSLIALPLVAGGWAILKSLGMPSPKRFVVSAILLIASAVFVGFVIWAALITLIFRGRH